MGWISVSETPAISIIIPTLNAAATLGKTLESLASQAVEAEAILVDGGSTDGTLGTAAKAVGLQVLSLPGSSIYEAINQGLRSARAPLIGLLNADDTLLPGALRDVLATFEREPQAEIIRGRSCHIEASGGGDFVAVPEIDTRANRPLTLDILLTGPLTINSMFFRRSFMERIGYFDTTLRFAADREWLLRVWMSGVRPVEIDRPLYCYLVHSESSTFDRAQRNYENIRLEHLRIIDQYLARGAALSLDGPTMRALHRWHGTEVMLIFRYLIRRGAWRAAYVAIRRAFSCHASWPISFVDAFVRWLVMLIRIRSPFDVKYPGAKVLK